MNEFDIQLSEPADRGGTQTRHRSRDTSGEDETPITEFGQSSTIANNYMSG